MRSPISARRLWLTCATGLLLSTAVGAEESNPETETLMVEIVRALRLVVPLSLNGARFSDPANRAAVDGALDSLAENAKRLGDHGSGGELGFAHLSESLARDSLDIRKRFAEGRIDEARFLLRHLTDTCVACHSRLPDQRKHAIGKYITEEHAISALPREERVQFEIATRQFDRALATYESLFSDPSTSLAELDLSGDLENYLELCLRVQRDSDRAISTLEGLTSREDLPSRLQPHVKNWIEALRSLENASDGDAVEQARELIKPALDDSTVSGNSELVRLIAASGLLHRYVVSATDPPERLGEAYYLLGVIESNIGRTFWASQTEFFLETAIRMGPRERYADDAFALLEEFLVSGYTGSSGTHVPPDIVQRLEGLDELMKRARMRGAD